MTDAEYKIAENLARRMAARQGLRLEKSRRRDPRALGYGTYQLTDPATNTCFTSGLSSGYGLTLIDVYETLTADE
jgi:hypothetical protein